MMNIEVWWRIILEESMACLGRNGSRHRHRRRNLPQVPICRMLTRELFSGWTLRIFRHFLRTRMVLLLWLQVMNPWAGGETKAPMVGMSLLLWVRTVGHRTSLLNRMDSVEFVLTETPMRFEQLPQVCRARLIPPLSSASGFPIVTLRRCSVYTMKTRRTGIILHPLASVIVTEST